MRVPVWRSCLLITIIAIVATGGFLWQGGALPLTDPDEGRYAEIAREMLASGDWIIPRLYGVAYLEKPPLLYWLVAASLQLLGTSELAARVVPALASGIGVAVTGSLACAVFGVRIGVLSSTVSR